MFPLRHMELSNLPRENANNPYGRAFCRLPKSIAKILKTGVDIFLYY